LAVALYDDGAKKQVGSDDAEATRCFQVALLQLEKAVSVAGTDARTHNNLGVVKLALDKEDNPALNCFKKALEADPNHAPATFNKAQMQGHHHEAAALQLDRTGAAGAMDDSRGKLELANAVTFAPKQQLEVHRGGRWQKVLADQVTSKAFIGLTYRLPTINVRTAGAEPDKAPALRVQYAPGTRLLVYDRCEWIFGRVERVTEKERSGQHGHVIETAAHGQLELNLTAANHAPALFSSPAAMDRAHQAYAIELKSRHPQ
jgi:tetratricopeptide (TPR) repeat protein